MKNYFGIILILLAAICANNAAAENGEFRLKNRFVSEWDGMAWLPVDKYETLYNSDGYAHRRTHYIYESMEFIPAFIDRYEFRDSLLAAHTHFALEDGEEVLYWQRLYIYSENDLLQKEELYAPEDGSEQLASATEYEYDPDGRSSCYVIKSKSGDLLLNISRHRFTYDSEGRVDIYSLDYWTEDEWQPVHKFENTYDASHLILTTSQEHQNGEWQLHEKTEYVRNQDDLATEVTISRYITAWVFYKRTLNEYDANGNPIRRTHQNALCGKWENDTREEFEYEAVNSAQYSLDYHGISIWPNPADDFVRIAGDFRIDRVSLIGENGRRYPITAAQPLNCEAFIALPELPAGAYILYINSGKRTFSEKIIIGK
ncbi:MAG: T9SS type A sorting domain-containing protein [Candidatus Kapaibacterium sp.]